jgi:hypothetical protein
LARKALSATWSTRGHERDQLLIGVGVAGAVEAARAGKPPQGVLRLQGVGQRLVAGLVRANRPWFQLENRLGGKGLEQSDGPVAKTSDLAPCHPYPLSELDL